MPTFGHMISTRRKPVPRPQGFVPGGPPVYRGQDAGPASQIEQAVPALPGCWPEDLGQDAEPAVPGMEALQEQHEQQTLALLRRHEMEIVQLHEQQRQELQERLQQQTLQQQTLQQERLQQERPQQEREQQEREQQERIQQQQREQQLQFQLQQHAHMNFQHVEPDGNNNTIHWWNSDGPDAQPATEPEVNFMAGGYHPMIATSEGYLMDGVVSGLETAPDGYFGHGAAPPAYEDALRHPVPRRPAVAPQALSFMERLIFKQHGRRRS